MKFNTLREREKSFSETNKQKTKTKNRPYMIVKDEFTNLLFNNVIMDWLGGKLLLLL